MSLDRISESFLSLFDEGDVTRAAEVLKELGELRWEGYQAHPLLKQFVSRNGGHCYRPSHLQIADFLTRPGVRDFRDAVLADEVDVVRGRLAGDPELIAAEFTASRGIAQAIHHWRSLPMAETLLAAGGNLRAETTLGESPLTLQLRFGEVDAVRFLLERGADPNFGIGGHMPSATMRDRIELMLEHGWDIDRGELLHDANHGHGARVRMWVELGADPNACNENGQTALHLLASRGVGRDAIDALLKAGADPVIRDRNGDTAIDLAQRATRQSAAAALEAWGKRA